MAAGSNVREGRMGVVSAVRMERRNVQKAKLYAVAENREKNPMFPSIALRSRGVGVYFLPD